MIITVGGDEDDNGLADAMSAVKTILSTESTPDEKKEAIGDIVEDVVKDVLEEAGAVSDEESLKAIAELLADKVEETIEEATPSEDVEDASEDMVDEPTVDEEEGEAVSYVTPGMEDKAAKLAAQREAIRQQLDAKRAIEKDKLSSQKMGLQYNRAQATGNAYSAAEGCGDDTNDDYVAAEVQENATEIDDEYTEGCGGKEHSKWFYINKNKEHVKEGCSADASYDEAVPGESGYTPEEPSYEEPIVDAEEDTSYEESVPGVSGYQPQPMFNTEEPAE